jgi:hypothetical protein
LPRIVPYDHHTIHGLIFDFIKHAHHNRGIGKIEAIVEKNRPPELRALGNPLSRRLGPNRRGADDPIRNQGLVSEELSHPRGRLLPALVQRPLMIVETLVPPARFGVTQQE